jgi:hypothetical protein
MAQNAFKIAQNRIKLAHETQENATRRHIGKACWKLAEIREPECGELFHFRIANCFKKWHKNGLKIARNPSKIPSKCLKIASKSL